MLNSNKTMSFKVIDSKLLEKYTQIWKKVKGFLNIKFSSEPIYEDNDKYIKKKIKLYGDKVDANFHYKKLPKQNIPCKCLSLIRED